MDIKTKNGCFVHISKNNGDEVNEEIALEALKEAQRHLDLLAKKRPWDIEPTLAEKAAGKIKKTSKKVTEGWGKLSFTEKCMAVTTGTVALKVAVSAFRELRLAWRFR